MTAKDYAQHCYAPNYAAKTGFLVRKEMVRSEVRSEKAILFVVLMKIAYTVLTWKEKQPCKQNQKALQALQYIGS